MRTAVKILIVVVALASVAWSTLFIYWHLKIRAAIRQLETETEAPGAGSESFLFLRYSAGCRALPYLIGALDSNRSPYFLERATLLITIEADDEGFKGDWWAHGRDGRFAWRIHLQDSPEERAKKCEMAREFWRQNGHRHHQMWRVWTRACVPNK